MSKTVPALLMVIVFLVSFAVYFNTLLNGFVWDDAITMESYLSTKEVTGLPGVIVANIWGPLGASNYYRPMVGNLYGLGYLLWGREPWGLHLVNILFHCGVSVLVFLIFSRLLKATGAPIAESRLGALVGALLFATHPIHTESVAWVSGITDVSFSFFYLLSFFLYIRWSSEGKGKIGIGIILSAGSFLLACLFKEPAVTLPFILVAYDYAFRRSSFFKNPTENIKRYLPYLIAAGAYFILRAHALSGFATGGVSYKEIGVSGYFINVFPLLMGYLEKLLLPVNLNAFYTFHPISSLLEIRGIVSLIIAAAFMFLVIFTLKRNRPVFFGLFLIIVPLVPTLYFRATGAASFAERYLYLPCLGFVFVLVLLTPWTKIKAVNLLMIFVVLVVLYSAGTVSRNTVWRENLTLFSDMVRKSPDAPIPHNNLGTAYVKQNRLDEAANEFATALKLKPDFADANNNLGTVYGMQNRLDEAAKEFIAALKLKPDDSEAHYNLGAAYQKQSRLDEAANEFIAALKLKPGYSEAHNNLGIIYGMQNRLDEAANEFIAALKLNPDNIAARHNLEICNEKMKTMTR